MIDVVSEWTYVMSPETLAQARAVPPLAGRCFRAGTPAESYWDQGVILFPLFHFWRAVTWIMQRENMLYNNYHQVLWFIIMTIYTFIHDNCWHGLPSPCWRSAPPLPFPFPFQRGWYGCHCINLFHDFIWLCISFSLPISKIYSMRCVRCNRKMEYDVMFDGPKTPFGMYDWRVWAWPISFYRFSLDWRVANN